jgi:acetyl-CoA acetyltransferase
MYHPTIVAGVGMVPFRKPTESSPYDQMGSQAIKLALSDAGIDFKCVEQVYAGYVYGDSASGQRAVYNAGMTGIPIVNVNNNCSTGSTALFLARQALESGSCNCVLAVGFEQMSSGALLSHWNDRPDPIDKFEIVSNQLGADMSLPFAIRYFGGAGVEHMEKYGTSLNTFAKIRSKASLHAAKNPLALLRTELTTDDVLQSPTLIPGGLTRYMACPPTCGAAAALIVTKEFAQKHNIPTTVQIIGQAMTTDTASTFNEQSMIKLVGSDMSKAAAQKVYDQAGIDPADIDVCELHDCFAPNELITYEALGFCPEGEGQAFVEDGDNTYGGKVVTNPSGGLLSKGHPLGATGLAQCYELTHQLRGTADMRQVSGARIALQHNLGLGGACVVTAYERTAL